MRVFVPRFLVPLLSIFIAGVLSAAEPPLVAVLPEVLWQQKVSGEIVRKDGGALAEQVQLLLANDPSWAFVERASLKKIETELTLGAMRGGEHGTVRLGRLSHADWVLILRLRADDLQRPRVEAEVVDTLRADLLARVETPLHEMPNESWLLQPNDATAALARETARRALIAAREKIAGLAGRTVVAPLAFINRDGTDRLAPLGAALHAALRAGHPGVRVLGYEAPEPAAAETGLMLSGMTEMDTADWSHIADVYLWGEFSEDPRFTGPVAELPITLRLWIWRDAGEPRRLEFSGTFATREALIHDAAARALAESVGGRAISDADLRLAAAHRLLNAGRTLEARSDPDGFTESRRSQVAREAARLRLIEVAAFFAPEDLRVREDQAELGTIMATDSKAEQYWTEHFWSVFDQALVGDGRPEDIALIARASRYDIKAPGLGRRFIRIGETWQKAAGPLLEARLLAIRFITAAGRREDPDLQKAVETLWPTLRHLMPERLSATARPDSGTILPAISHIYKNDPARGQALLAGELITDPIPPVWLATTPPTVADSSAPDPDSAFERWKKTTPVATATALPPDGFRALETPTLAFSPWNLVRESISLGTTSKISSVYLDDDRLWIALREPLTRKIAERYHPRNTHFRIELASARLARTSELLSIDAAPADVRRVGSETWVSTRGAGLRVLDRSDRVVATITSAAGLAHDHVPFLAPGKGAFFLGEQEARPDLVARVDSSTKVVSQASAPFAKDLPGITAAVRAAIDSFGDETAPKVRLPAAPLIIRDAAPSPDLSAPLAPPAKDDVFVSYQPTGAGDGYWIADRQTVLWAAGSRRVPLAHWPDARVFALADDGRHLFVLVGNAGQLARRGESPNTPVYGTVKIHVYDHHEGAWRGWFAAPAIGRMSASPGLLCIASDNIPPISMINTSGLRAGSADTPPSRPPAPDLNLESGWTPLHAALWADDARAVAALLGQGASPDYADARGWSPVQIAAAWASPACLEALLRRGLPVEPRAPDGQGYVDFKYNDPLARQHPPLRAAALSGREENLRRLLDVGAAPRAGDSAERTLLQSAIRRAPPEVIGLLLSATPSPDLDSLRELARKLHRVDLQPLLGVAAPAAIVSSSDIKPQERLARAVLVADQPDLVEIRAALVAGADPCAATGRTLSPLLEAAGRRHIAAIEAMLPFATIEGLNLAAPLNPAGERRGDPRITLPSCGVLVLRVALEAKRPDLARRLLAAGVAQSPGAWDGGGETPPLLWLAISSGDAELTTALRKAGFTLSSRGRFLFPLHEAVAQKNAPLLTALLAPAPSANEREKAALLETMDRTNRTALHVAVAAGWTEGVQLLLAAGASVPTTHLPGEPTILDAAMPWPEIVVLLNQRPGDPTNQLSGARAVAAIHKDDPAALAVLSIDAGVLRYRDIVGWTVLHHAIAEGRTEFVARLVKAGADVDAFTSYGDTPLAIAAHRGRHAILVSLLAAGARPDLLRGEGNAPLLLAARNGDAASVRSLLAAHADPNLRSGENRATALLLAAEVPNEIETAKLLVAAGASLNATNAHGFGVLEYALDSDSGEKIQYLVDRGAVWRMLGEEQCHPMNYAAEKGLVGSIRKLQQLGLQSPRALSLAKDDATRAALQGDDSEAGRRFRADEEQWPALVADPANWRERIAAHVKSGGNPNHLSYQWGTPLMLALRQNSPEKARFLVSLGADPARPAHRPGDTLNAKSPFYFWLEPLGRFTRPQDDAKSADLDVIALQFLDIFWVHERSPETRAELIRRADQAGLPRATAWMRTHPAP